MREGITSIRHRVHAFFSIIRKKLRKFFGWLGPRRTLLFFLILISILTGIGTLLGYSSKPIDAPHLLIPETLRGAMWISFALVATWAITKQTMSKDKIAILFLSFMPLLRLVSYLFSWLFSLDFLTDALFNDVAGLQGSSSALYLSIPYQLEILLLIAAGWSPHKWKTVSDYIRKEIREETGEEKTAESGAYKIEHTEREV